MSHNYISREVQDLNYILIFVLAILAFVRMTSSHIYVSITHKKLEILWMGAMDDCIPRFSLCSDHPRYSTVFDNHLSLPYESPRFVPFCESPTQSRKDLIDIVSAQRISDDRDQSSLDCSQLFYSLDSYLREVMRKYCNGIIR